MTTETVHFNKPEIEVPETDKGRKYCSLNNLGRDRMTSNPDQSSKHEANFPNNDETSMEIVLEEGREAARERQAQDPAIKLGFHWSDADKTARKRPLANVEKKAAIAAGEDALALWCVREQLELAEGVLYQKWLTEGTNSIVRQFVVPTSLRKNVLEQLHESKMSRRHFAFQKTLDRARQRFWWAKMRKDIERKCENCLTCQSRSTAGQKRKALFQTINVGIRFKKIAADILGTVTETKIGGYKDILVLTDYFNKFVVSTLMQNIIAEAVARAIVEKRILFGAPGFNSHWPGLKLLQ